MVALIVTITLSPAASDPFHDTVLPLVLTVPSDTLADVSTSSGGSVSVISADAGSSTCIAGPSLRIRISYVSAFDVREDKVFTAMSRAGEVIVVLAVALLFAVDESMTAALTFTVAATEPGPKLAGTAMRSENVALDAAIIAALEHE